MLLTEFPKQNNLSPEFNVLPVALSDLPLLLLDVVVVARVQRLDLHVLAVAQTDVRHVVGEHLEVFLRGLINTKYELIQDKTRVKTIKNIS